MYEHVHVCVHVGAATTKCGGQRVTFWFFPSIMCSGDLKLSSSCLVVNAFAH